MVEVEGVVVEEVEVVPLFMDDLTLEASELALASGDSCIRSSWVIVQELI